MTPVTTRRDCPYCGDSLVLGALPIVATNYDVVERGDTTSETRRVRRSRPKSGAPVSGHIGELPIVGRHAEPARLAADRTRHRPRPGRGRRARSGLGGRARSRSADAGPLLRRADQGPGDHGRDDARPARRPWSCRAGPGGRGPLGVAERPRFLVDALTGGGPLPEWDEAAAAAVGDVLVDRLARRRGNLPLDPAVPRLLRAVAGRRCGRWLQVLGPATDPAVAFRAVADLPARYRQAATQLVLIRCLYAAPGPADVRRISQLTAPTDEQAAQLLMNACLACRPGVPPSPVPYLLYLCHSVEFGRLPSGSGIRPRGTRRNEWPPASTGRSAGSS